MNPWLRYSLVRIGIFGAVFVILWLVGIVWWLGAIFATVISFSIGYIFFSQTRESLATDLKQRAERKASQIDEDAKAEDG